MRGHIRTKLIISIQGHVMAESGMSWKPDAREKKLNHFTGFDYGLDPNRTGC